MRAVALLRGINVGKAKRIAMADLRRVVEQVGGRQVATLLASGNVVFTTELDEPAAARTLREAIAGELGVECRGGVWCQARCRIVVDDAFAAFSAFPEIAAAAREHPSRLQIALYLDAAVAPRLQPLAERDWGDEALRIGADAALAWCPRGLSGGELAEELNRAAGAPVTVRKAAPSGRILAAL